MTSHSAFDSHLHHDHNHTHYHHHQHTHHLPNHHHSHDTPDHHCHHPHSPQKPNKPHHPNHPHPPPPPGDSTYGPGIGLPPPSYSQSYGTIATRREIPRPCPCCAEAGTGSESRRGDFLSFIGTTVGILICLAWFYMLFRGMSGHL
ncbi:hypothetical protein V2G26_004531 [Clonostachys chloroleuca]